MATDEWATLVRDSLDEDYQTLQVDPRPWPSIEADLRAVRRRRRRRTTAAGAAALSILLLGGAIGTLTGWLVSHGDPAPLVARPTDLPTRGSLAGNSGFLAGLRAAGLHQISGRAAAAGQIKVLYAGDIGDYRLALLDLPAPKLPGGRGHLWLRGRRGDAATVLLADPAGIKQAEKTAFIWVPTLGHDQAPSGTGAFVVLGLASDEAWVLNPPIYRADGSTSWPSRPAHRSGAGWWQETVSWSRSEPSPLLVPPGAVELTPLTTEQAYPHVDVNAALPPLHTSDKPDPGDEWEALGQAQLASRLPVSRSTRRVLWSGILHGARTTVVAVTAPSGAHVLFVYADQFDGHDNRIETAARVVPAGPLDRIGMAWLIPQSIHPAMPEFVGLMAPNGAERARVHAGNGVVRDVQLVDGAGQVSLEGAARVEFMDARGRVVAQCQVTGGEELPFPSHVP